MNQQIWINNVEHFVQGKNKLLVAFSGGLDSTVLLHLLMKLRLKQHDIQLRAIHIHHHLSKFADQWSEHCQKICHQWQIPLSVIHVNAKEKAKEKGIEAAARQARYQAFADMLQLDECLLTAQHLDDQCETFLLALKRGSGPAGLSSMAKCSVFHNSLLLRPLLEVTRKQLECYAQQHELCWIEDDSNTDQRYDRNFIRQSILPLIYQRWPYFAQSVARSAELCAEQEQLLDELLSEQLSVIQNSQAAISIVSLQTMSNYRRQVLLRLWLAQHNCMMPSRQQLNLIWQDVALSRADATPCMRLGEFEIRRFKQYLYCLKKRADLQHLILPWTADQTLTLPDNMGKLTIQPLSYQNAHTNGMPIVRRATPNEKITIRFTAQGNIKIIGRHHSRSIKKLWQEFSIPPWLRSRIPLLFYNDTLIAALGVFVTHEGEKQSELTENWLINWIKPKNSNSPVQ